MDAPLLSRRALNRALLARQHLLERVRRGAWSTIEHLVAMQGQEPPSPHIGLWTRLDGFEPAELDALHTDRHVVRGWLMRTTLHTIAADDYVAFRGLFDPVAKRAFLGGFRRDMAAVDLDVLAARAREVAEAEPRGAAAIGRVLAEDWPDVDPRILGYAAGYLVPMVQLPPRGLWGDRKRPRITTAEAWLGRPLDPDPDPAPLAFRYLAAFGPASPADFRAWSGITGAAELFARIAPRLRRFRDERGRELFDVPGCPLPDPETPAPVRYPAGVRQRDPRPRRPRADPRRRLSVAGRRRAGAARRRLRGRELAARGRARGGPAVRADRPAPRGRDRRRGRAARAVPGYSGWRMTGRFAAPASSSRRTGVV